jgi:pimeloyl-ACP methyl ester carboxylesterase
VPTLIIWGVHDQFLGRELVSPEVLLRSLAYGNVADVAWIETAGHFVQNEAPDEVNAALLDWVARHEEDIRPL